MIPISKPIITNREKQAVLEVMESGYLVQGPRVAQLESMWAEVCGTRYAIATSNGTAALHVALLAQGIQPGDEVITTPFTFIASVNAILFTNAKPVFVDIDRDTFNIDVNQIERAITQKTKAILPVHVFGQPAQMDTILDIAQTYRLAVIEDCAQSIGAFFQHKKTGSFGTGCFSLYATKNVMCGEGGMITTSNDEIARKCRLIRAHGSEQRYFHDMLGYNYRMSDLHAAIGIEQIKQLETYNSNRRSNAEFMLKNINNAKVILPVNRAGDGHVWHQFTVRIVNMNRDVAIKKLTEAGIGTGVFYPVPAHKQRHILDLGIEQNTSLSIAEQVANEVLSLPVHPMLSKNDLEAIVDAVNTL
jgi:dTDP-4-amino-4,6-dideoxygalactose transaminase